MEGATTVTLASILGNIGSVFTSAMEWAAAVGTAVAGNPLLLVGVVMGFVGVGVGLFRRLLRL